VIRQHIQGRSFLDHRPCETIFEIECLMCFIMLYAPGRTYYHAVKSDGDTYMSDSPSFLPNFIDTTMINYRAFWM
jgi:hypothetical protein